jgi:rsbT co-antagonist protein RsbR
VPDPFRAFFFEHPASLLIADAGGVVQEANAATRAALGDDFGKGAALAERVPPEDREGFERDWTRLVEGQAPLRFICRLRTADGEWRHFAWNARRAAEQPEVYATLTPLDEDHAWAKQQAKLLQAILGSVDVAVYAVDAKGDYLFNGGKAQGRMGLPAGSLLGKNLYQLYGGQLHPGVVNAMAGEGGDATAEFGGMVWHNWFIPLHGDHGEPAGMVGFATDITESHRARAELEQKLALIARQEEVIRNLETPIIQVWDKVVTLPMVGTVDSRRAGRVMDDLLESISRTQARFAILDLTGVDVVDTATANHFISMIRAVRLLGAEGIITGIRPNVAQTMVTLGLDLSSIATCANLRQGLSLAIRRMEAMGG